MKRFRKITAIGLCFTLVFVFLKYFHISDVRVKYLPEDNLTLNHEQYPKHTKNVYIILVDGLRYDSMLKNMPELASIIYKNNACLIKARFEGPSNSRPGYARIFTGTPTSVNGIYRNNQKSKCLIPSIFKVSRDNGLKTGASAYYWFGQLFNDKIKKDILYNNKNENIQHSFFYSDENENDEKIVEMGITIIKENNPNLMLIHTMEVDMAGHKSGALSALYSKSALKTDKLIQKVLSITNFNDSTVIIMSDHGHKDRGGHGGSSSKEVEVPVIIIGKDIKGGIYDKVVSQEDVAPTICTILGIPFTPYMTGSVIDFPFSINRKYLMGPTNRLYKIDR